MRRFGLSLALLAAASTAFAQGAPPQYFVIHQELAKPSMIKEYEAAAKEFAAMVRAHKARMPHFAFEALMSRDFVYTYVAPVPNMAGIDGINEDFSALAQAAGKSFLDLMRRGGDASYYTREWVAVLAPELSYDPAQPRLRPDELVFFHTDYYYLMPGRETEADAVAQDFVKLLKGTGPG